MRGVPCSGDGLKEGDPETETEGCQTDHVKRRNRCRNQLATIGVDGQHVMWEYVGMGRTAEGLKEGLKKMKEIRKEFETNLFIPGDKEGMNVELDKAIRLYDFITMGELVAYDALNRDESCGGHFREEYQTEEGEAKRDDENFFYVACWEYQGSDEKAPVLLKEPLVYEAIKVQTRNYKS